MRTVSLNSMINEEHVEIDVRGLPPHERHRRVVELFDKLRPGQTLVVVNDHEQVHLLAYMKHERRYLG